MANGDPMISRKLADNPFAAKAAETAILLPSKWSSKRFGEGGVVYVGHASLYSQRKPSASLDVAGKYRTGQPISGIIRNAKCFRFSMDLKLVAITLSKAATSPLAIGKSGMMPAQ